MSEHSTGILPVLDFMDKALAAAQEVVVERDQLRAQLEQERAKSAALMAKLCPACEGTGYQHLTDCPGAAGKCEVCDGTGLPISHPVRAELMVSHGLLFAAGIGNQSASLPERIQTLVTHVEEIEAELTRTKASERLNANYARSFELDRDEARATLAALLRCAGLETAGSSLVASIDSIRTMLYGLSLDLRQAAIAQRAIDEAVDAKRLWNDRAALAPDAGSGATEGGAKP